MFLLFIIALPEEPHQSCLFEAIAHQSLEILSLQSLSMGVDLIFH